MKTDGPTTNSGVVSIHLAQAPVGSKKRSDGKQRRTYKFGLVSTLVRNSITHWGFQTDWRRKMDDLVISRSARAISASEGTGKLEQTAWSLVHLGATVSRKVGVDVTPLDEAESCIRSLAGGGAKHF